MKMLALTSTLSRSLALVLCLNCFFTFVKPFVEMEIISAESANTTTVAAMVTTNSIITEDTRRMHVTLISGREIPPLVVLRSVFETSKTPSLITIHVIFENLNHVPLVQEEISRYSKSVRDVRLYSLETIQQELVADGVKLAWSNDVWDAAMKSQVDDHHWLVHPARFLKGEKKVLFLDDDIVVLKDISLAFQHSFQPNRAILGSCLIPSYNPECEYFEIRRENFSYANVPFFGFPSFNVFNKLFKNIFCSDPLSNNNKWHGCIEKAGYETILRESERINGKTFSFDDKAWNFGYVMIDINAWFQMELTEKFNKWMDASFKLSLMPPSSIGFGLGIPYLAFAGSVQCFDSSIVLSMEGLGFMYPDEFLANNITTQDISKASYLHYTGENKPWSSNAIAPYHEYWNKYWLSSRNVAPPYRPKQLVLMISSQREGSEWAMNALDHQDEICATGEIGNSFKSFPTDMLVPPQFAGSHQKFRDQTQHCNRMAICSWRFFSNLVTHSISDHPFRNLLEGWRYWYLSHRNRTELFKGYLLAISGEFEIQVGSMIKPQVLQLPCRCPKNSGFAVVKVFLEWIAIMKWERSLDKDNHKYGIGDDDRIDILRVFQELKAKVIFWRRLNTKNTFQSIINAHKTGMYYCQDMHCARNVSRNHYTHHRPNLTAVEDKYWREFDVSVSERRKWLDSRMLQLDLETATLDYENCQQDQISCSNSILQFLGIENKSRNIFESATLFKIKYQ